MQDTFSQDVFFQLLIFFANLPFVILIFSACFWGIYSLKKRSLEYMRLQFIATIIIVMFLAHPNILRMMLSAFACTEIEKGEYWLLDNMDIRCWAEEHAFYATFVAFPGLLVWGIITPGIVLILILKNRKDLEIGSIRKRFGFLLLGYKRSTFYWEFIILYRKVLIVFVSVFMSSISTMIQALVACFILFTAFYLQSTFQPFEIAKLNRLEEISTLTAATTIYCGLLYLTDDLDEYTKMILFIIMVLMNIIFVIAWIINFLESLAIKLHHKSPRLARLFCRCYVRRPEFQKFAISVLGVSDDVFDWTKN